jgi:hypothetical protein
MLSLYSSFDLIIVVGPNHDLFRGEVAVASAILSAGAVASRTESESRGTFDKNQLSGEIHGSMRGLRWIIDEQMTVNRGLRPMSRGL